MTAAQARKLIGRTVTWKDTFLRQYTHEAVLLEVSGKNVRVQSGGVEDWLWLPDVPDLREKQTSEAA